MNNSTRDAQMLICLLFVSPRNLNSGKKRAELSEELKNHNYAINLFLSGTNVPLYCDRNAIRSEKKISRGKIWSHFTCKQQFSLAATFFAAASENFFPTASRLKCGNSMFVVGC